jgi:Glucodextranase, domain B/Curli production assembly/transport component CsgG
LNTDQRALLKRFWVLSLLICCLMGCAVDQGKVYEKGGKKYGVTPEMSWRGRWWDHYQRGSSYADGEFWQEAIADFQAAIRQRESDQHQARTYGLHFLDYFPHRELGVVYYRLKRYPEAIDELETSLGSVETAKAKFYINKARKAVLEQTRHDKGPPQVVFDSPADGLLTNRFAIRVSGHTADDTYVSGVSINGRALFIELAEPRISFERKVPLEDGENFIEVTATDLLGRSTKQGVTVHVDRQGPLVSLDRVDVHGESSRRRARIRGVVSDRSHIVSFSLAGHHVPLRSETEWEFHEEVPLSAGMAFLPFAVEDAAGNLTRGEISLGPLAEKAQGVKNAKFAIMPWPLSALLYPLTPVPSPIAFRSAANLADQLKDRVPPLIELWEEGTQVTVYNDTFYLGGRVTDDGSITAFNIDGKSFWRRPSRQILFGQFVSLKPGDNRFVLHASDGGDRDTRQEILVTYVVPEVKRLSSRLRVFLLPFKREGETSVLGEMVYDSLYHALVNQKRFRLVERVELGEILKELKLSRTELVDPATAVKIGKIAAAEGVVFGTVAETQHGIDVYAHFSDVETSEILASVNVYGEDLSLQVLKTLMEGLAWKMRRRFPLVEGVILEIEKEVVTVNLTIAHGIREHMKLLLFREGKALKDPRSGKIRKKPAKRLGEARIKAVSTELSEALLLQPDIADKLQEYDKVVTK